MDKISLVSRSPQFLKQGREDMSNLIMNQIFIKNTAACNIQARPVRLTKTGKKDDPYNDFQPGHYSQAVATQQVLNLNLGMMTGMGGPGNLEEFFLEIRSPWDDSGNSYYWTSHICQRDDTKPHIWLKATGTAFELAISEYGAPTAEDLAAVGLAA